MNIEHIFTPRLFLFLYCHGDFILNWTDEPMAKACSCYYWFNSKIWGFYLSSIPIWIFFNSPFLLASRNSVNRDQCDERKPCLKYISNKLYLNGWVTTTTKQTIERPIKCWNWRLLVLCGLIIAQYQQMLFGMNFRFDINFHRNQFSYRITCNSCSNPL